MLRYFSYYNSGGGSSGISEQRTLHLCFDGSFAHLEESLATLNVPGASASSGGNAEFLVAGGLSHPRKIAQCGWLMLMEGGVERLHFDGEKTFLSAGFVPTATLVTEAAGCSRRWCTCRDGTRYDHALCGRFATFLLRFEL